ATVPSWTPVDGAWLRSPSGREVALPLDGAGQYAAVTPRIELDGALVEHARRAGATILDGHAFADIAAHSEESIIVEVDGVGPIRTRFVIAADGMWSPVRK